MDVEPSEQPLGLPAFWVLIFPLAFSSLLLELISEIISKELRVFLTHFPVHVTQALEVHEREVDGPEGGVNVRQLEQPSSAFPALSLREEHSESKVGGADLNYVDQGIFA